MTKTKKTETSRKYDANLISEKILDNIDSILSHFNIEYEFYKNSITGCCPIHGGDNSSAFSILLDGVGNWRCFTHCCHEDYGNPSGAGMVSLVQALLAREKKTSFRDAIEWVINFLNVQSTDLYLNESSQKDFINLTRYLSDKPDADNKFYPREAVIPYLQIPSQYYLKRDYKPETLAKFDVGECYNSSKEMYNRAVVPFYDATGKIMVGCSGRSIFDKCDKCNFYHNPQNRCPMLKLEKAKCMKWRHSAGFNADSFLYNYHYAAPFITQKRTAILVESPGNTWRMDEAGLFNVVGTLGTKFTQSQQEMLELLGVENLVLAFDNDDAGRHITRSVQDRCDRFFNIYVPKPPDGDIGETNIDELRTIFKEYL